MSPPVLRRPPFRWILGVTAFLLGAASVSWLVASAQSVSAGQMHSAALETNGTLALWGYNGYGELGDGTNSQRSVPTEIPGTWTAVSLGSLHTLALKTDGTVWAWGYNGYGQLGDGTSTSRNAPVQVSGLTGVVAIAAGDSHSVAVKGDGTVWAWGYNGYGQLGDGTTTSHPVPIQMTGITGATLVSAGASHTLVGTATGVLAVGYNGYGQLGDGTTTSRTTPVTSTGVPAAVALAAGSGHSLAVASDGSIWAWGYNGYGQLGDGTNTSRLTAIHLTSLSGVSKIATADHVLAVKSDGTVWSWGSNAYGQLGDGTTNPRNSPAQVAGLSSVVSVAAGSTHSLAVTSGGVVYAWGSNNSAQLGNGSTTSLPTPSSISGSNFAWKVGLPQFNFAAGTYSTPLSVVVTCATPGATIYYTLDGSNPTTSNPTIGTGGTVTISQTETLKAFAAKSGSPSSDIVSADYVMKVPAPTPSPYPSTYTTAQTVSLLQSLSGVTIYYTLDGTTPSASSSVYSGPFSISTQTTLKTYGTKTGWNDSDVFNGTYYFIYGTLSPPTVSPATGTFVSSVTVSLSCAAGATARYTTDNTLPVDTSAAYVAPIVLTQTTTLKSACFQLDHAASAVTSTLYTVQVATPTLSLSSGSYPAGTQVIVTSPTPGAVLHYTLDTTDPTASSPPISSGTALTIGNFTLKVKAMEAGAIDSAIVSASYTVTGSFTQFAVAAGENCDYVLSADGTVWAWGANAWGQLGDGTTNDSPLPKRIPGLTGVTQIVAFYRSAYVLRSDGTVWGWGLGVFRSSSPVKIEGLSSIVQLSAGEDHLLALKADGTVWAFGDNSFAQLGDGTTNAHSTPIQVAGLTGVTSIGAGALTSFAVTGGRLYAWGYNENNSLGLLLPQQVIYVPTLVAALQGVADVRGSWDAMYAQYMIVLGIDGSVNFIGDDAQGYLTGQAPYSTSPRPIAGLSNVTDISTALYVAMALTADGSVISWGAGALGDGTNLPNHVPHVVPQLPPVISAATGGPNALAVTSTGLVYTWGTAIATGTGSTQPALSPVGVSGANLNWEVATPTLSLPAGTYSAPISVTASCLTPGAEIHYTTDGSDPTTSDPLWQAGTSQTIQNPTTFKLKGFLAGLSDSNTATYAFAFAPAIPDFNPNTGYQYSGPVNVTVTESTPGADIRYTVDGSDPTPTSTAYSSPIAISTYTTLKATAYRSGWQPSPTQTAVYAFNLGTLSPPVLTPAPGTFQGHLDVTISGDPRGTILYTTDGSDPSLSSKVYNGPIHVDTTTTITAFSFNQNYTSSSKVSATYRIKVPAPVFDPPGGNYPAGQDIAVSVATTGAVIKYQQGPPPLGLSSGTLLSGQMLPAGNFALTAQAMKAGCDPSDTVSQSYTVSGRLPDTGARVALGGGFGLFIDVYGQLYSWGEGSTGQLGDGTSVSRRDAQMIARGVSFKEVAAGADHALAVGADGSLWAWGSNQTGQLGLGDVESRDEPTAVQGVGPIVRVSAGAGVSYAVAADGSVFAWGRNDRGQLGTGKAGTFTTKPARISTLSGVRMVSAGTQHVLVVTAAGDLYAWGANGSGQLGDGTTNDRTSPTKVAWDASFVNAAAGDGHSLAVTTAGQAVAFGDNTRGEIGNGSKGGNVPVPTATLVTDASGPIAAGQGFSIACAGDGTCVGFGANDSGQLGIVGSDQFAPVYIPSISGIVGMGAWAQSAAAVNARGQLVRWGGASPLPYTDVAVARAMTQAPQPVITGYKAGQDYVWWGDEFTVSATNLDLLDKHLTVGQFPGYAVQATSVADTGTGDFVATFKVPYDTRGGRFFYLSSRGRSVPVDNNIAPIQLSPPVSYNGILSVVSTDFKAPKKEGHVFISDADGVYDLDLFAQPFSSSSNQKLSSTPGGQLLSEVTADGKIFFVPMTTGNADVMVLDIATGQATKWASTTDLKDNKTNQKATFTAGAITSSRDGSTVFIWDKDTTKLIEVYPNSVFFVLDGLKFPLNPVAPVMTELNQDSLLAYNTKDAVVVFGLTYGPIAAFPIAGIQGLSRANTYFDNDPTQPNAVLWCGSLGCATVFNPSTHRAAAVTTNDAKTRVLVLESSMWTGRVVTDRVVVANPNPTTGPIPYLSDAQIADGVLSIKVYAPPWQTVALRVIDPPDNAPYVQPQSPAFRAGDNKITSVSAGLGTSPQGTFSRCLTVPPADRTRSGTNLYQVYLNVPADAAAGDNYRIELSMSPFADSECSGNDLPDRPLVNYSGSVEVWRQIALEVDPMYRRGAPLARRARPGDNQVWLAKLNLNPGSATPAFQEVDQLVDGEGVTLFGASGTGEGIEPGPACVAHRDAQPADAGPDVVQVTLKHCITGKPYSIQGDYFPSYAVGVKDLNFNLGLKGISGLGATTPPQGVMGALFQPDLDDLLQAFAGAYVEFFVLDFGAGSRPLPYIDEKWFARKDLVSFDWFSVSAFRNYIENPAHPNLPGAPLGDLPHATWHIVGASSGLFDDLGKPAYGLTASDYDLTTFALQKMERDAKTLNFTYSTIAAWVAAHEFGHHFNVNACSKGHHDEDRFAWTTALKINSGEVCVMRGTPPLVTPPPGSNVSPVQTYQHFDLAHFCIEELVLGDPACQGAGTSMSPRQGSIRGYLSSDL